VKNKISRLARQAIAVHKELRAGLICQENLVADGFESFCVSQYFPNNINLLLLKDSQYLYYTNYVTIRRKGRMTPEQKQKREELEKIYRAPYKGIEINFYDLLHEIADIYNKSNRSHLILYYRQEN